MARIEASIRAGTGGVKAEFARCNPEAVVDFYDGRQTPSLITHGMAWTYGVLVEDAAMPKGLSLAASKHLAAARTELLDRRDAFQTESIARAKRIAAANDENEADRLRLQGHESSNRAAMEADALAERTIRRLKETLSKADFAALVEWLDTRKRSAIILRLDYARVSNWDCPR